MVFDHHSAKFTRTISDNIGDNVERGSGTIFLFLETVGHEQRAEVVDDGRHTCIGDMLSLAAKWIGCWRRMPVWWSLLDRKN